MTWMYAVKFKSQIWTTHYTLEAAASVREYHIDTMPANDEERADLEQHLVVEQVLVDA